MRWQNDRNAILYDCSFSEEVERVLFHPLSSLFLKENHFLGGSCVGLFGLFGPKGALGCQEEEEQAQGPLVTESRGCVYVGGNGRIVPNLVLTCP